MFKKLGVAFLNVLSIYIYTHTLKRNRNATPFQWKMHWVVFTVLDRDNETSSFQIMLKNSTLFEMTTNKIEAHPCKDNVSISLR